MADDLSVKYSAGFVEGWIEKVMVAHPDLVNGDVAIQHLQIVVEAYDEHRKNIGVFKSLVREVKGKIDIASNF
jgi:hypothetical protein